MLTMHVQSQTNFIDFQVQYASDMQAVEAKRVSDLQAVEVKLQAVETSRR
jgi:hypothetical protein